MKKKLALGASLLVLGLTSSINASADYEIDESYNDKQKLTEILSAQIVSGGLYVELGQDGVYNDIDLGKLSIGKPIESKVVPELVTIKDFSGLRGYKLTVKNLSYDINNSLFLTLDINNNTIPLRADEAEVDSGYSSTSNIVTHDGVYSAEWGLNPKAGDFSNTIEWVVSPLLV